MNNLIIYCDGGARGNPGPAAAAFVVTDSVGKVVHEYGEYLKVNTNNYAEYSALLLALKWLDIQKTEFSVIIKLDSELVVKQTTGIYKVKSANIFDLAVQVGVLRDKLGEKIKVVHIPREQNYLADVLVNKVLDGVQKNGF